MQRPCISLVAAAPLLMGGRVSVAGRGREWGSARLDRQSPVMSPTPEAGADITRLLQVWSEGDERAFEQLIPLVYGELHRMALRHLRGEQRHVSLQATAGERSLPPSARVERRTVAESSSLLWCVGGDDAASPRRHRQAAACPAQGRRRSRSRVARRHRCGHGRAR